MAMDLKALNVSSINIIGFIDMYYDENDSTFHTLISFSDRM